MAEHHAIRTPSVLVIDDSDCDAVLAEIVVKENLSDARIDHAPDGSSGLERLRNGTYDLVLLDLAMPGLSGFDVLERLHTCTNFTGRVVVLSSSTRPSDHERVAAYGCEYVEKHSDFSTFRRLMTATLVPA